MSAIRFRKPTDGATRDTLCVARGCQGSAVFNRDRPQSAAGTGSLARVRGLAHRRGVPGHREGARRLRLPSCPGRPGRPQPAEDRTWLAWAARPPLVRSGAAGSDRPGQLGPGLAQPERRSVGRQRQRAAARPGPSLVDDPHRQRGTRTDSAWAGTGLVPRREGQERRQRGREVRPKGEQALSTILARQRGVGGEGEPA